MKKLLLLTLSLLLNVTVSLARYYTDNNGVTWYYNNRNDSIIIYSVQNAGENVVVPGTINDSIVAGLDNTFCWNTTIKNVKVPTTVASIEYRAFYNCTNLLRVEGLSNCKEIGYQAFCNCTNLQTVDLEKCTSIDTYAFYNCGQLTSIGKLSNCQVIGYGAFQSCSSLQILDLENCISIDPYAFCNCGQLTSIGNLSNCQTIGHCAFSNCSSLQTVDLENCISIGYSAFSSCGQLKSVGKLLNFQAIREYAFSDCSSLQTVDLSKCDSIYYNAFSNCNQLTSVGNLSNCKYIGVQAFYNCYNLQTANLINCTLLGDRAFCNCSKLTSVGDLSKLQSIGTATFEDCNNLETVDLKNCNAIGSYAFWGCSKLTSVGDFSKLQSIGNYVFSGCSNLTATINLDVFTSIPNGAFVDCKKMNFEGTFANCTYIGNSSFSGCKNYTDVKIKSSVLRSIRDYAFKDAKNIEIDAQSLDSIKTSALNSALSLSINTTTPPVLGENPFSNYTTIFVPDGLANTYKTAGGWSAYAPQILSNAAQINYDVAVTANSESSDVLAKIGNDNLGNVVNLKVSGSINSYDFMVIRNKMPNLHSLDLSDANIVTSYYEYYAGCFTQKDVLGNSTFSNLGNLVTVKLPTSITSIGSNAFSQCINLEQINIPEGVTLIDYSAFYGCSNLQQVTFPSTLKKICSNCFDHCSALESISIPADVDTLDVGAFNYCTSLREAIIPSNSSLKLIDANCFYYCSALESISLPASLKSIGSYAFSECPSLKEVIIPSNSTLESIGYRCFNYCYALESINLPASLITIDAQAFNSCSSLKNVVIPSNSSLTSIGSSCFAYCKSLENISFPKGLKSIGNAAFTSCSLKDVRIPSSLEYLNSEAFANCPNLADVYVYSLEPLAISENTFSNYVKATLHVPSISYQKYYWDAYWSKFGSIVTFDADYDYIFINNDLTINDGTGLIGGVPDVDVNPGAGLIVKSTADQNLGDIHLKQLCYDLYLNGSFGYGSIIGNNNINANNLYIDISMQANWWYFLSFPYRVKLADIVCEGSWVFRYYDGEERANNGYGGWKNLPATQEYLEPGIGYIFRCNQYCTLQIPVAKTEFGKFAGGDRQQTLVAYAADGRPQDASWNFLGNPYPCYYDIDDMGYDSPITVWNGSGYESVRPGDDVYHLRPFQAFFVQKPSDKSTIDYNEKGRHTYLQWNDIVAQKNQPNATRGAERTRYLINLQLTDGENIDKTRVVYNNECTADYEIGTDASKFMTAGKPQLYSLDNKQINYAINERPEGEVILGYIATQAGELTISATRMDQAVVLYDAVTGTTTDLANGDYTFTTDAGTFNQRFVLKTRGTTNINSTTTESADNTPAYNLNGIKVEKAKAGQVVIKSGKKIISK